MWLWRVVLPHRADDALSGEGARRFGGRWNRPGQAAVYTSTTVSLAVLEWLAHVDSSDASPELVAIAYDLPDDEPVTRLEIDDLPDGWRGYPVSEALRRVGAEGLEAGETVELIVPSVVFPLAEEYKFVLNPGHAGMARLSKVRSDSVAVDPRLVGVNKP